MRLIKMHY
jgi:hypothetical protein